MENNFANNLKHLRIQSGMTQNELAKKLNKDYSTIGKWELGQRYPIMTDVIKIAELFDISVDDLIMKNLFTINKNSNYEANEPYKSFNEKIDKFMKETNIRDIKQLADSADIPYATLKDFYEKNSADNSRLSTIRKLAEYMGCTMDYLTYNDIENPDEVKINGYNFKNTVKDKDELSKEQEYDILKNFLTEKGVLDKNEEISEKSLNTLMNFARANKQFIIEKKDSEKEN